MTASPVVTLPDSVRTVLSGDVLSVHVDTTVYGEEALFRACYQFTDRCYLYLRRGDGATIVVDIKQRESSVELSDLVGTFCNELIDQRLRVSIARDTAAVRELIVRQAFAEERFDEPAVEKGRARPGAVSPRSVE
jgi:His-Xaa-Ser system protein HxsD